jgi:hypothetical protein
VIATIEPRSHREASSSSPITGTPAARARLSSGISSGTPGLITIKLAVSNDSVLCSPSSNATPAARNLA